jgi:hypothetical protein
MGKITIQNNIILVSPFKNKHFQASSEKGKKKSRNPTSQGSAKK